MYKYGLFLAAAALLLGACAAQAQNADTVDGFHAYGTPHANALLALDGSSHFPVSVIPDNSIPGSKLVPGAVTAGRLRDGAVVTSKLADQAVTTGKLAYGAVTAGRLGNNSVTTTKISDGAIRGEDVHIPLLVGGSRDGYLIGCFNSSSGNGASGICGYSLAATGYTRGVVGACKSQTGKGVYGLALGSPGTNYGVYGESASAGGRGVYGISTHPAGNGIGVYGRSDGPGGRGVYGWNSSTSGWTYGVSGKADSSDGRGVYGYNSNTATYGYLGGAYGVYGYNYNGDNYGWIASGSHGVYGRADSNNGVGVRGSAHTGSGAMGVFGSGSGWAGYFSGKVEVNGDFDVTGSKNFKIDHPLDPENMYLYHSCVESAERMNIYNGRIVLDRNGEAWVSLPDWFEALNCDFLYQLTPIGVPANLYIAREIENGYFKISGGAPGMSVCWQVTGTRQDPYALAHPFEVEVEKPDVERGYYAHPELYGMPETQGIEWATNPEAMMEVHQGR